MRRFCLLACFGCLSGLLYIRVLYEVSVSQKKGKNYGIFSTKHSSPSSLFLNPSPLANLPLQPLSEPIDFALISNHHHPLSPLIFFIPPKKTIFHFNQKVRVKREKYKE